MRSRPAAFTRPPGTDVRRILVIAGLALALHAPVGLACGYCVEDKIASVYDYAIVTRSLAQKHHVAFFHIDGAIVPGEATKRALEALAESTPGVDRGSVRVSVDTATLSVAFDPRRSPMVAVQAALDKKLAAKKLAVMPLRIIDAPAALKTVKR